MCGFSWHAYFWPLVSVLQLPGSNFVTFTLDMEFRYIQNRTCWVSQLIICYTSWDVLLGKCFVSSHGHIFIANNPNGLDQMVQLSHMNCIYLPNEEGREGRGVGGQTNDLVVYIFVWAEHVCDVGTWLN